MLKVRNGVVYLATTVRNKYAVIRVPKGDNEAELLGVCDHNEQSVDKMIEEDVKNGYKSAL